MSKYVLTVDRWTRVTGKGDDRKVERFFKGDVVELNAEEAARLEGAVEEPGASQRAEAERLQRDVDALQAQQDAIEAQVSDAQDAAKRVKSGKPAEDDGLDGQTVAELRVEAEAAGVEDVGALKTKAALVDAIRSARSE